MVSGSAYMHFFSSTQPVCLLVGAFNLFTFKVISHMYDPITIFLIDWGLFCVGLFLLLCFPAQRSSFSICCKAGLVVLNSLNVFLSGKLLISTSNLKEELAGQSIHGCGFFSFITLHISCYSIMACSISVEKSANCLMGIPCMLSFFTFSFNTFCLYFFSV